MKINEVEQLLGISKANIRFYEKQNLLAPRRTENGYRDYTDEDVRRLRDIVILRKLGISVQDIEKHFNGEISLQDTIQTNITQLETQIEQLNGALQLSRQIERENAQNLDTERYWQIIQEQESAGMKFMDIIHDYWSSVLKPTVASWFGFNNKVSTIKIVLVVLALCVLRGIGAFIRKDGTFIENFLYFPLIICAGVVITLPIFLLGKKYPKAAGLIMNILSWLIVLFIAFLLLVIIIGLIVGAITN